MGLAKTEFLQQPLFYCLSIEIICRHPCLYIMWTFLSVCSNILIEGGCPEWGKGSEGAVRTKPLQGCLSSVFATALSSLYSQLPH